MRSLHLQNGGGKPDEPGCVESEKTPSRCTLDGQTAPNGSSVLDRRGSASLSARLASTNQVGAAMAILGASVADTGAVMAVAQPCAPQPQPTKSGFKEHTAHAQQHRSTHSFSETRKEFKEAID